MPSNNDMTGNMMMRTDSIYMSPQTILFFYLTLLKILF